MRKAKITTAIIAVLILAGFSTLAINSGVANTKLNTQTIKLQSTEEKLKEVNQDFEQLKTESSQDKAKKEQLEKEKKVLEAKLQAKAEAKAKLEIAANRITQGNVASAASLPEGSHEDWMKKAGIAKSDFGYVNYIVNRESGWNPNAVNAQSGACGLGQQLPCGKWAGAWNDPIAALVAMQGYAKARYGSWSGAYNFWLSHNWW